MRLYIAQFVSTVLVLSSSRSFHPTLATNAIFPSLISSNEAVVDNVNLDCVCKAFDVSSILQQSASLDRNACAEGFDLFLSAYLVTSSHKALTTCQDLLQLIPQDYCGYPDDPAPFSLDKTSSKLCSSTTDKSKCFFETFRQPNTPCYWSGGRQCYWNSATGTCQGTLSSWFIQAYGLSPMLGLSALSNIQNLHVETPLC
jgi:hypothetical protein